MTPNELHDELKRLAEKATPGPFIVSTCASPEESKGQVTLDALRSGGMGEVVYRYAWIKNRADCDLDAFYRNNHGLILRALSALSGLEGVKGALNKAAQMASICSDWNLDEVEIDGVMVRAHALEAEFRSALSQLDQLEAADK